MRKVLLSFLLVCFVFWLPLSYRRWTHAFRLSKCLIDWPFVPEWETNAILPEMLPILKQPFFYLAKGTQSYVFLSEDQKTVLKLFKYDQSRIPFSQQFIRNVRKSLGMREKHFSSTPEKVVKNFTACKLAYTLAQKQTGVLFVHLNPKKGLPQISLKDRLGVTHKLDPEKFRFILQRKAEPFLKTMCKHKDQVQLYLNSYKALLEELTSMGLIDLDPTIGRNFGFLDGRAVLIDVGNLKYCPEKTLESMAHFELKLHTWLEKHIPEAAAIVSGS